MNNERGWFQAHKEEFLTQVDQPTRELAAQLAREMAEAFPKLGLELRVRRGARVGGSPGVRRGARVGGSPGVRRGAGVGGSPRGRPSASTFDWVSPTTVYVPKEGVERGSMVLDREQYAYHGRGIHAVGHVAHGELVAPALHDLQGSVAYRTVYEADGTKVETQDMGGSSYKMRPNTYYYNPLDGAEGTA